MRTLLFLGKADDARCTEALSLCRRSFWVTDFAGAWGDPLPQDARDWDGDYIVSYLSRWVVPKTLLDRARIAAINFHPGSPDYPGIGCVNFALYNGATEYGATCHHMLPKVDTGSIIATKRVPVLLDDNVESLLERTYAAQFELFREILQVMAGGSALPASSETWTREPYTRREFNQLNRLTAEMDQAERARRIRCCAYRQYSPPEVLQKAYVRETIGQMEEASTLPR